MKKNQQGFGAVEGLLIVVVVAVIAFVGWYIYNGNKKASNTYNAASTSSKVTTTGTPKTHTTEEAVNLVQTTYDSYLTELNKANSDTTNKRPVAQVALSAIKNNLTPELYAKAAAVTQATPFSCTQQYVASAYSATLKSNTKTTASVALTIDNGSGANTSGMTALVNLVSLKITAVTCPA